MAPPPHRWTTSQFAVDRDGRGERVVASCLQASGAAVGAPGFVTVCVTAFPKFMRQAEFEPTTLGSGGGAGERLKWVKTRSSARLRCVRFSRVRVGFGSHGGRLSFRVFPANGTSMSVHGPGSWTPIRRADSVSIVWTTGFSLLTMKLAVARDTLRGGAETFWGFPRAQQTSEVTDVRVACE